MPMQQLTAVKPKTVLLTGATGFVGKVVLEELLRRQVELHITKIYVLIRPGRNQETPTTRFQKTVRSSLCFKNLPQAAFDCVSVVSGDLIAKNCGLKANSLNTLQSTLTTIINCAASIDFDLPIKEAAAANITSGLNVLELSKGCTNLESFVNVSTAYVTPCPGDVPIYEEPVSLPRPAAAIYQDILNGKDQKRLLAETGHANTYTFTKCLAEHLLEQNKEHVPLCFVRPSIISVSWQYPFKGWIDSNAALAAFVCSIGSGLLRVLLGLNIPIDVVPCDEVSHRIINRALTNTPKAHSPTDITYAVAGKKNSSTIKEYVKTMIQYFRQHPVQRKPKVYYRGTRSKLFHCAEFLFHVLPYTVLEMLAKLKGDTTKQKLAKKLKSQLKFINQGFYYFTHNSFDFRARKPFDDKNFNPQGYSLTVCQGVREHIFQHSDQRTIIAGKKQPRTASDLRWALSQPKGNFIIRLGAYLVRKAMRRCTDQITFDKTSFERATKSFSNDQLTVIVPTHRSYMDFVLCSYLFFSHPELKIAIPHIAAAEEFSRIKFLGKLLAKAQAFYIKRGLGRENKDLTKKIHKLVQNKQTLEFFIEGTRSRSRQFLSPRRGILKCLKSTGQNCVILPVSINFDRVPEDSAFVGELKGGGKPRMHLKALLVWLGELIAGRVKLGQVHIACGQPLTLNASTDIYKLSRNIMAQLQKHTMSSTYHLKSFLNQTGGVVEESWLMQEIQKRGGNVLKSPLAPAEPYQKGFDVLEPTLRYQWLHLFYQDIRQLLPNHPAIEHHIATNHYLPIKTNHRSNLKDPQLMKLLRALFERLCQSYRFVATAIGTPGQSIRFNNAKELVAASFARGLPQHLPFIEAALDDLVERQILIESQDKTGYSWGPQANELADYKAACQWPFVDDAEDLTEIADGPSGFRRVS